MLDVIIVGAGASGLSAALAADEQGLDYLVLEQRALGNTVLDMPSGKRVFDTPVKMPLRGQLWFGNTTREELLEKWREVARQRALPLKEHEGVTDIQAALDGFQVRSERATYSAKCIVLAIGTLGNPRKIDVPGEGDSSKVFYRLRNAEDFTARDILVVGGGDSAIEAALALCERNRVTLSYRKGEFFRLKYRNACAIEERLKEGALTILFNSRLLRIDAQHVELGTPEGMCRLSNDVVFALIGSEPPNSFLDKLGVAFTEREGQKVPRLNERFETSVAGLYLVGAVSGRPLIKRAINQGYDVIQHVTRELRGTVIATARDETRRERRAVVEVNLATCTGCGVCEAACPQVFKVVEDKSNIDDSQVDAFLSHCLLAAQYCPTDAIRVVQRQEASKTSRRQPWRRWRNVWQWRPGITAASVATTTQTHAIGADERLQVTAASFDGRSLADIADFVKQLPFLASLTPTELLKQVPLFAELSEDALAEVAAGATLRYYDAGMPIIREGDFGESFFVILSGSVHAVSTTSEGAKLFLATQGQYDFFGEMAALTGFRRSATVTATTPTTALEIEKYVLLDLLDMSRLVKNTVTQAYTDRVWRLLFGRVPLFKGLRKASMERLMRRVELHVFPAGSTLVQQGEPGQALYVIRNGVVKITKRIGDREHVLAYLRDGTYFGEMAMLRSGQLHAVTVSALTKVEVAQIMREEFQALLQEEPQLRLTLQDSIFERVEDTVELMEHLEAGRRPERFDRLESLQEVVHTTDVLVIDLHKCIHCDACVQACETIHDDGVSRLIREGIKIDHYLVATSCRNCEDPLCMTDCPVSAIARDAQGEVYIKDHCVSCGACVENCPYGNINLFDPDIRAAAKHRGPDLWRKFMGLISPATTPGESELHKAVKCDLCKDFLTPNCVRSCPTGAAMRVNPQTFFKVIA